MTQLLQESGSAPVKSGNLWRAVLITPGKGSSGIYTEDMLKEYGPQAFKKGTHSYVDHPRNEEDIRSPKNIIGVLAEDASYEEGVGLIGEISIMPHWKEFVEAVAPYTGLSIYAMGEGEYNDDGEIIVENLVPHVQNSVDLVSYPGREGSKLADKLYEAAISMATESYHYDDDDKKKKKKRKEAEPGELAEKDLVRMDHGKEMAYGQVAYIMTSGVFPFEGDPLAIKASPESPVALVRVWMQKDGEWEPTQMLMGHAISELTKISELGEMPEDEDKASAPMGGKDGTAEKTVATESNKKEERMELKELSDQLAELPNLVAAAVVEALAPNEDPEEEEEKEEADVAAIAEAMVESGLPEVSRKAVYESLRTGGNLAEAIESQKAFVESVKSHFKEESKTSFKPVEESVIVTTEEKAPRLSEILNVKVGA